MSPLFPQSAGHDRALPSRSCPPSPAGNRVEFPSCAGIVRRQQPLSSLPSVGYQPSGAASDRAKTQQKTKVSSEVIVLSDEESPTSPIESLKDVHLFSAHQKYATPNSAQQSDYSD